MTLDEEMQKPFVPLALVEYLRETYNMPRLLEAKGLKSNDEHMGYLKGVQEVVTHLDVLSKANED